MIFITLGSQKFQFNRLLKAIDNLIAKKAINDKVFAQIGYSDYEPRNFEYIKFLDREEFSKLIAKADIIITHGGTGGIITAVKQEKKVIAIPRLSKYGEHVDDHQLQLIKQFEELNLICSWNECEKLDEAINIVKNKKFERYKSNTENIINSIITFIERNR